MKRFLFIGILLICIGCQSENTANTQEEKPVAQLDSLSKEKIKLEPLKLSPQAEKSLKNFEDFQNLRNFVISLRNGNSFYINKHADSINVLIGTFKENLSEDLNVNTINSRIGVLATESGLLRLLTEKKNPDSEKIMEANTRLIKAYNSLIIQLNELSLAIPENIEKELLKKLDLEEEE
ncbi:hypothetical protein [Aquimarina algiphila]|uniref:hypothetical protein n=1 Tax=Aquimarina algiphila TaxID=2047982 RepID=UPI00232E1D7D|nr:hypothetical protein [Aquimarina algiphila]